jgi:hypothetical protein
MARGGWSARLSSRHRITALAVVVTATLVSVASEPLAAGAVRPADWPAFLHGPAHASDNPAQVAITPRNASTLVMKWHFVGDRPTIPGQPGPAYNASPTVADGAVFIGSRNGWFYKLSERTGVVMDKVFIGFQPHHTCNAGGFVATATVARDPAGGRDTVYVDAPDGYLYALRAVDLSVKWRSVIVIPSTTVSDYFPWSSPTVLGGRIYVGVSSHCDDPLVRGGVFAYDQATGNVIARYYDVPKGVVGGSVWSSVAADSKYAYVSTGNKSPGATHLYATVSIVELDARTLARVAAFQPSTARLPGTATSGHCAVRVAGRRPQQERLLLRPARPEHDPGMAPQAGHQPRQHPRGPVHRLVGLRRHVPVRRRRAHGLQRAALPWLGPAARPGDRRRLVADRPAQRRPRHADAGRCRRARGRDLQRHPDAERRVLAERADSPDPTQADQEHLRLHPKHVL